MELENRQTASGLHLDVHLLPNASGLAVMFGGGTGSDTYESRRTTTHPALAGLMWDDLSSFVFVACPPDVAVARLEYDDDAGEAWIERVEDEVFSLASGPIRLLAHSGGAALALNGLHLNERVRGIEVFGGDQIPMDVGRPEVVVVLHYNRSDRVFDRNQRRVQAMLTSGTGMLADRPPGGHSMQDYVANGLGRLRGPLP